MARGILKISKEISLPIDAVTQTFAAIGRKGAGKTYLSTMIAEQMLEAKAQVVVLDAVGVWWGLRVNADGKTKGKEIFVIGGDNGDVPLVPEAGRRIAQLIVEKEISAVLDVSGFRIGERKRFCADFGEEFFQLKKQKRSPVHIFLEEAQLIVPQMIRPDEGRMYSAFEQIVRLGRNYGIGCTLITQRPQSVNKEVLSQVECLCVLQVTGPHERKAIEYWVQEAGAERALIGELPGLQRGEGYVWSPSWLRIYERVHFSTKTTFDASATPEVGKKTRSASLSAVDVQKLREDIADVVAQAEKDDPVALKKKILNLERELKNPIKTVGTPADIQKAVNDALWNREKEYDKERSEMIRVSGIYLKTLNMIAESVEHALKYKSASVVSPARSVERRVPLEEKRQHAPVPQERIQFDSRRALNRLAENIGEFKEKKWGPGELAVLGIVAQYSQEGVTRERITVMTGYSRATRNTYLQRLAMANLIRIVDDKALIEQTGIELLGSDFNRIPEGGIDLIELVMHRLPPGEVKILQALIEQPAGLDRESLSDITGFTRATRNTYIQRLGTKLLIKVDGPIVKASEILI